MRRILVFDNYDSFTWNLVQVLGRVTDAAIEVHRNDKLPLEAVEAFDAVVLSPGPGIPAEAGQLLPLIRRYAARKPLLGVCLGHQAIGEAFGAKLLNMSEVFHGVATPVHPAVPDALFAGLSRPFAAGRYHSWTIDPETVSCGAGSHRPRCRRPHHGHPPPDFSGMRGAVSSGVGADPGRGAVAAQLGGVMVRRRPQPAAVRHGFGLLTMTICAFSCLSWWAGSAVVEP